MSAKMYSQAELDAAKAKAHDAAKAEAIEAELVVTNYSRAALQASANLVPTNKAEIDDAIATCRRDLKTNLERAKRAKLGDKINIEVRAHAIAVVQACMAYGHPERANAAILNATPLDELVASLEQLGPNLLADYPIDGPVPGMQQMQALPDDYPMDGPVPNYNPGPG